MQHRSIEVSAVFPLPRTRFRVSFPGTSKITGLLTATFLSTFFTSSAHAQPAASAAGSSAAKSAVDNSFYFYSGGRKYHLPASTSWTGVNVTESRDINAVVDRTRSLAAYDTARSSLRLQQRNIVLLPVRSGASTGNRQSLRQNALGTRGVVRPLRVFGNGQKPIIETDELVVRFKPGISVAQAKTELEQRGAAIVRPLGKFASNGFLARISGTATTAATVANSLYEKGLAVYSHPDFVWPMQKRFVPDDPLYSGQWHLNNTGQNGGLAGADIKAPAAWDITRGRTNVVIAVNDDGVDTDHPDLKDRIVAGFDFVDGDDDPRPGTTSSGTDARDDHGTACAGIAAASGNNGIGVSGVAPNVKIMPLRSIASGATLQNIADSFMYAADHGADIISNSWGPTDEIRDLPGGAPLPDVIRQAIDYAITNGRGGKGCAVFFAAGNSNRDTVTDGYVSYSKVIGIGGTNNRDAKAPISDFGSAITLVAPAGDGIANILTADRAGTPGLSNGDYTDSFFGNSAACPQAAGVAALILSIEPNLTWTQIRDRLKNTADKIGSGYDGTGRSNVFGYGRINAAKALLAATTAYSVSGRVTTSNGTGVAGVTVTASSTGGITTTDNSGNYTLPKVAVGNTSVSVSKAGYDFTPASRTVTVSANTSGINFSATALVTTLQTPASNTTVRGNVALRAITTNDAAVQKMDFARRVQPFSVSRTPAITIPDMSSVSDSFTVTQTGTVDSAEVSVNITHAYSGDLIITLVSPNGTRTILRSRLGGSQANIVQTFTVPLNATPLNGTWKLEVADADPTIEGKLNSWNIAFSPTWVSLGSVTSPVGGAWSATWNTSSAPAGLYDFRALATTAQTTSAGINTGVMVEQESSVISGAVRSSDGKGVPGVTISRGGSAATVTTDATGAYTFGVLPAGTYTITPTLSGSTFSPVSKTVQLGATGIRNVDFVEVPTVTIVSPQNGATFGASALTSVSGTVTSSTATTISKVGVYLYRFEQGSSPAGYWNGGTSWTTDFTEATNMRTATGTRTWSLALPTLPSGRYRVRARAYLAGGQTQDSDMVSFFVNSVQLGVSITTPTANSTNASVTAITGTATDGGNGSAISKVTAYLYRFGGGDVPAGYWAGGTNWTTDFTEAANMRLATGSRNWSLALPALPGGRYRIRAKVHGTGGQELFGEMQSFFIDSVKLGVSITSPAVNSTNASVPSITGTASDGGNGSAIGKVAAYLYRFAQGSTPAGYWAGGTNWTPDFTEATNMRTATGTRNWSLALPTLPSGRYRIRAKVYGTGGQEFFGEMQSFFVDSVKLGVSITTPAANSTNASVTAITGTASDGGNGSAISKVTAYLYRFGGGDVPAGYWAGGTNWTTDFTEATNMRQATGSRNWSLALPALPGGRYRIRAKVHGTGGQELFGEMQSFFIDSVKLGVSITVPTAGSTSPSVATVSGTATDGGNGTAVSAVRVYLYRFENGTTPAGYWNGGASWTSEFSEANMRLATGTLNWSLALPSLSDGRYRVRAKVYGTGGQELFGEMLSFFISGSGVQTRAAEPASGVRLSAGVIQGSTIRLTFTGPLDPQTAAAPAHYGIVCDGKGLPLERVVLSDTNTVILAFSQSTLASGDLVTVSWEGLLDTRKQRLPGGAIRLSATQ